MPFNIIRNDIVNTKVDAIVNSANKELKQGGGVCGRIFEAAGPEEMTKACDAIGVCPPGSAVITPGFKLPAKYVIHAVGPAWEGGNADEEKVLRSAYRSSLELAASYGLVRVAFPMISAGYHGYPIDQAFVIALDEINRFLFAHEMDVTLVMFFSTASALRFSLHNDLQSYIDDNYVEKGLIKERRRNLYRPYLSQFSGSERLPLDDREIQNHPYIPVEDSQFMVKDRENKIDFPQEKTFSESVLSIIDAKGMTDTETYKRSNIDRRHFSKIRSNPNYAPSKATVLALCIGLHLTVREAQDLLARAGFAFSPCDKRDLIVRYFLEEGEYDIAKVNGALYDFDSGLLGG